MATETIPDYPRGVTFEQVWAGLHETKQLVREVTEQQKETARRQKETDRQMQETDRRQKETDRQMKESERQWNKRMGELGNRLGELIEHLVAPGMARRFQEFGYHFSEIAPGGLKIEGDNGKVKAEIDLLLQNGDTIMAVEIKVKPDAEDITDHIKRLEILSEHRHKINDRRNVEGAIAGAIFSAAIKKAIVKAGLYVIEQSGDTMKIEVPEGFVPRKW